jgi:hypothetical protein
MTFYNNQSIGEYGGFWIGQVVDEANWIDNVNPKFHNRDDIPGWGSRCKVRIIGRDPQQKVTPDDKLEMAEIWVPTTAGSGHGGAHQTHSIRQGCYVAGFYKDGIDKREPVVTFILPNNSQTRLFGGDPDIGYVARSGYLGKSGNVPVSTKNIYLAGPNSSTIDEAKGTSPTTSDVRNADQQKDGNRCHYIPKTKACDGAGGELKGIQKFIKDALALINRIKAEANAFLGAASDLTASISQIVNNVSSAISGLFKTLLGRMRGYITKKLNAGVKDLLDIIVPNQRAKINQLNEKITDTLQCVFNKIINRLKSLVSTLLGQIIDKYINAPLCAVESFVANLLSSVLGDITGAIQSVISQVSGVLGKIGDIAGKVFDVLDMVTGILNFLSCDEPLDCTMGEEWSFWGGVKCATTSAKDAVSSGIKSTSDKIKGWIAGSTDAPPCNTSQLPCGPPTISITGGGGSGVLANPIISATGSILGIDFVNGGSGYVSPPNINIVDSCGIGNGAVVVPIISTSDTQENTGLTTINEDTVTTTEGETVIEGGSITITNGSNGSTEETSLGGTGAGGTGTGGTGSTSTGVGNIIGSGQAVISQAGTSGANYITNATIMSSGGKVTSTGGNTVATTTGGNTTGYGLNVSITGGTSTFVNGVQTVTGGKVTLTGGTVTTNGGSTQVSSLNNAGSIVGSVIVNPGTGYLSAPNGSTGGNGSVFSKVGDTILFNSNSGYNVYGPNQTISVLDGDLIYTPAGTVSEVYNNDGEIVQTIIGKGGTSPINITSSGTLTTPNYVSDEALGMNRDSPSSNGSYPVVLTIKDVAILNGGVNYDPNDEIVISPDNGAELKPIFNDVGRLIDVKIINSGIGFTEFPNLFIQSQNGINAVIVPVFDILRVNDLSEDQDIIPPGTPIISVVDCVGRVI